VRVAVVRNDGSAEVINRFGQVCPEVYGRRPVERVAEGLEAGGHSVEIVEGDMTLPDRLRKLMPSDPRTGAPTGFVFNMAYGIQGECRYTHVPAMLEMTGVPYTGSTPLGHALCLDKVVTKILIRDAGVPTPRWLVASQPEVDTGDLRFPLIVKPRHESTSFGLRCVTNQADLQDAIGDVLTQYQQDALVEEYIAGREVCIGLLGNDPVECLPLVELDFGGRDLAAFTWEDKMHTRLDEPQKRCPADVDLKLADRMRQMAVDTFRACHCKDYARVDIRIDAEGNPFVLEINSMASLGPGASYALAARQGGYDFGALVCRILDVAHRRYFGRCAPRDRVARSIAIKDASGGVLCPMPREDGALVFQSQQMKIPA